MRNRLLLCRSHQITEKVNIDLQSLVDFDLQNFEIINQRRKTSLKRVFKSFSRGVFTTHYVKGSYGRGCERKRGCAREREEMIEQSVVLCKPYNSGPLMTVSID